MRYVSRITCFVCFFVLSALALSLTSPGNAQEEKKKKGFWFSSSKRSKSETETKEPRNTEGAAAPVKLGLSSGVAYIPQELKELAQEGANAIAKGQWSEARELYLKMVLQAPDNPLAYANLGVAEYQMKNFVAAEGNLKKSLELNSTIAQNWTTLGLIQFEKGDLILAISSLTRAIHEDPNSAQAHLYLAAVAYDYGWTTAAIDELKRVIELDPKHIEAHFNLALTYIGMKPQKLELARRHYFEAKALGAPPHQGIEKLLGNLPE